MSQLHDTSKYLNNLLSSLKGISFSRTTQWYLIGLSFWTKQSDEHVSIGASIIYISRMYDHVVCFLSWKKIYNFILCTLVKSPIERRTSLRHPKRSSKYVFRAFWRRILFSGILLIYRFCNLINGKRQEKKIVSQRVFWKRFLKTIRGLIWDRFLLLHYFISDFMKQFSLVSHRNGLSYQQNKRTLRHRFRGVAHLDISLRWSVK